MSNLVAPRSDCGHANCDFTNMFVTKNFHQQVVLIWTVFVILIHHGLLSTKCDSKLQLIGNHLQLIGYLHGDIHGDYMQPKH